MSMNAQKMLERIAVSKVPPAEVSVAYAVGRSLYQIYRLEDGCYRLDRRTWNNPPKGIISVRTAYKNGKQ